MILKLAFLFFFITVTISSVRPDTLLETMMLYWNASPPPEEISPCQLTKDDLPYENDSDAEIYHWELGTPDNVDETEVIVDPYQ